MQSYFIIWAYLEYKVMEGWKVNFLKVVRVSHQPIFPLAYTCPTQFIFLDFLVAPKTSLVHLISSFFYFNATRTIKNSLPFIPMGPTPKERKALNSSLPITLTVQQQQEVSFYPFQALVPNLKLQ